MKPKTKEQKFVCSLQKKISKINNTQLAWGKENLFDHLIYTTQKECTCFECGHKWKEKRTLLADIDGLTCPNCNKQRKISKNRHRVFKADDHFMVITTFHEYQVIRFVHIFQTLKVGQPARYDCQEVVQHWISPKGKRTIFGRHTSGFNYYRKYWYWSGKMELRGSTADCYFPRSEIYPKQKIIPNIIRNGFTNEYHKIHPSNFFKFILSNSRAETLLKKGWLNLFSYYYTARDVIDKYWPSIKICFRNNYEIHNPSTWIDQLGYLEADGKDLHNAKYVCPADFDKEHQKYINRERRKREREQKQKMIEQMAQANIQYEKDKAKYLDFFISHNDINIQVLQNIEDFLMEGNELHHCVYNNTYYGDKDSLILSARKKDKRLETIQLSLKDMKIVQSRGLCNQTTEYHDTIIALINDNLPKLRSLKRKRQSVT